MEKTSLYLPAELQEELRAAARRLNRSQADIVRDALAAYLAEAPRPRPSLIGVAHEPAGDGVDSSNVKDWVAREWSSRTPRRRRPRARR